MTSVEEFKEMKKRLQEFSESLNTLKQHIKINEVLHETVKAIENKITLASKDANSYEHIRRNVSVNRDILPDKFNILDVPKFKSTDNPFYHLSAFENPLVPSKEDIKKLQKSIEGLTTVIQESMKWSFLHKCEPEMTSTNDGKRRKNGDLPSDPSHQSSKKPITSKSRVKRTLDDYTPIGMTYDEAFDYLHDQGLIVPIGPIQASVPCKRSSKWNPSSYCKYHRGNGHTTDECFRFRNLIQDLIDANKLPIPPATKKTE